MFDTQRAPFSGQPDTEASGGYPLVFFPLGKYAPKGVHMFMVDRGEAVEIPYSADFFDMPADNPARQLPPTPALPALPAFVCRSGIRLRTG
ncbi:glucan biosynthesis protein [Halopseudomonas pachastrellae]|nr:glucan biosynthesis protein [Halopseudomonas pachastrellae]